MTARPDEVVALPDLPRHKHAFCDPEGEQPDILVYTADQMRAYAESALQSANARLALAEAERDVWLKRSQKQADALAAVLALADEWVSEVGTSDCPTPTMAAVHECAAELRRAAFGENNGR